MKRFLTEISAYRFSRNVNLFVAYSFLNCIATSAIYSVLLGIYLKNTGHSESFIGNIIAIRILCIGVSSIPIGILSAKLGRRNVLVLGVALNAMGYLGMSLLGSEYIMYIASVLCGIGSSISYVNDSAFIAENCDDKNSINVYSINFIVSTIAVIIGSIGAGKLAELISNDMGISVKYTMILFSCIAMLPILLLLFIKNKKVKSNAVIISYRNIFKTKKLIAILTYTLLLGSGSGLVVPFFNLYLENELHMGIASIGFIMAYAQIATLAGASIIPYISKRTSNRMIVQLSIILSVPFLLTISMSKTLLIVGICFLARYALMNMMTPAEQNIIMDIVDEADRTTFSSIVCTMSYLARALSASIAGLLMLKINYDFPYYIAAIFYIGAFVAFNIATESKAVHGRVAESGANN